MGYPHHQIHPSNSRATSNAPNTLGSCWSFYQVKQLSSIVIEPRCCSQHCTNSRWFTICSSYFPHMSRKFPQFLNIYVHFLKSQHSASILLTFYLLYRLIISTYSFFDLWSDSLLHWAPSAKAAACGWHFKRPLDLPLWHCEVAKPSNCEPLWTSKNIYLRRI